MLSRTLFFLAIQKKKRPCEGTFTIIIIYWFILTEQQQKKTHNTRTHGYVSRCRRRQLLRGGGGGEEQGQRPLVCCFLFFVLCFVVVVVSLSGIPWAFRALAWRLEASADNLPSGREASADSRHNLHSRHRKEACHLPSIEGPTARVSYSP